MKLLPRIGAALVKFLEPIASSDQKKIDEINGKDQEFQRFKNGGGSSPQDQQSQARQDSPSQKGAEDKSGSNPEAKVTPGISHTFVQLFSSFNSKRQTIVQGIGKSSYQKAFKGQRKAGKFRKGSVLDKKAE